MGVRTLWVVGDSTVCDFVGNGTDLTLYYPRYGYGTQIGNYINSDYYTVVNLAASGRSSKSFLTDSAASYKKLIENIKKGDALIIGFGHNDEKLDAARYTNPNGDYMTDGSFAKSLYDNYVKPALDKGAAPILCTPIVRRSPSGMLSDFECHIIDTAGDYVGGDYPQAIRDLGAALDVPVIDLTALTKALYEESGADETLYFHAWTSSRKNSVDNTHLNIYGAKRVAYMLAAAISGLDKDRYAGLDMSVIDCVRNIESAPEKKPDEMVNEAYSMNNYTVPTSESRLWAPYGAFRGTVFGDVGNNNISDANFSLGRDSFGNMRIAAFGKGKIASYSDGIAMYYCRIPAAATFTLTATATVNSIGEDAQAAFGLMARDDMYIDDSSAAPSSDYVVAGTFGKNAVNCFYRKDGKLSLGDSIANPVSGDVYKLSIVKTKDGYTCRFGNNDEQSAGYDFALTSVDSDYQYIGMFAARSADISFGGIALTVDGEPKEV